MLPGDQLGPYQMIRALGQGATADVFLAEYTSGMGFSRRVAVKVIKASLLVDSPSFIKQFQSEARLGGLLSHANIIQTVNFGCVDGIYYLALEHVDGPTLTQLDDVSWSAGLAIPPTIAIQIVVQVCDALAFAHAARNPQGQPLRMIHRDIKLSNIMITRQGGVKVLDFGIAKAKGNLEKTQAGVIKGTLPYMSPEQAMGEKLDHRSDIWSAGVVLYRLLTGESLYKEQNLGRLIRDVQDGKIINPQDTLPRFKDRQAIVGILKRALSLDLNARYQRAQDMAKALRALIPTLQKKQRLPFWIAQRERELQRLALRSGTLTQGQLRTMPYLIWTTHIAPSGKTNLVASPGNNLAPPPKIKSSPARKSPPPVRVKPPKVREKHRATRIIKLPPPLKEQAYLKTQAPQRSKETGVTKFKGIKDTVFQEIAKLPTAIRLLIALLVGLAFASLGYVMGLNF